MRDRCVTYVDVDLKERFLRRFGEHGAISFALEAAMSEALAMTEGQPELEDLFRQAIRTSVLRNQFQPNSQASQ